MNQDSQHLQLLSIFHYVMGGMKVLFGCFPIFYLVFGIAIVSGALDLNEPDGPPPEFIGWFFIAFAGTAMMFTWGIGVLQIMAGRKLAARRGYTYCFVIACIECIFMPLGTLLGVFTILVLKRPEVKALFGVPVEAGKGQH